MKLSLSVLSLVIFTMTLSSAVPLSRRRRVVGGTPVNDSKAYPWAVLVNGEKRVKTCTLKMFNTCLVTEQKVVDTSYCTGTLVDKKWIVTAAHCFSGSMNKDWKWHARIGMFDTQSEMFNSACTTFNFIVPSWNLQCNVLGTKIEIEKIIIHPASDHSGTGLDIAVAKLKTEAKLSSKIQPAQLPSADLKTKWPPVGEECDFVGWGKTSYPSESSPKPNRPVHVKLPVLPWNTCSRQGMLNRGRSPGNDYGHNICAGYVRGGKGIMDGDSGGGLVCKGPNGDSRPYLAGVLSMYMHSVTYNYPAKFARLTANMDFINEALSQ